MPPVSDGSGQDRALAAQGRRSFLQQAGFAIKDGKRRDAKGEPHRDRVPDRRADLPAAPHALHQEPRHARHRRDAARRRSGAVPQARRRFRLRRHGPALQFLDDAGRLRCAPISPRRRRPPRARRTSPASPTRRSTRWSTRSSPPRPAPALITACRALDRVIRAGRYWVPHWYKASHWIAYWDVFGRPPRTSRAIARGIPETWWYDPRRPQARAAALS